MTTPLFELPEMEEAQQNPHIIYNSNLRHLEKTIGTQVVNEAGENHNIVAADWGAWLRMTSASAQMVTVPENATLGVAHTAKPPFRLHIRAAGTGGVTFVAESVNVVINGPSLSLDPDNTAFLINVADDEWDLVIPVSGS